MTINKNKREKIKKNLNTAGKVAFGFCAGAAVVGVASALKLNRQGVTINKLIFDRKVLSMGVDIFISNNKKLEHELDIRDCMIMEGIDGDTDIYARRMEHFRDYKIQTTDIEQNEDDCADYCHDAAVDADVAYLAYTKSQETDTFISAIPVIKDDTELPF